MWKSAKTSRRAVFSKSGGNSTEEEKQATRQKKQQKPPRKVNPLGSKRVVALVSRAPVTPRPPRALGSRHPNPFWTAA